MNRQEQQEPITRARHLRRLLLFQIKLALDAARDFALSPISIVAFLIDMVRRPPPARSFYNRLMGLGRRSDEVINLFEEHSDSEQYTVDRTLRDLGKRVERHVEEKRAPPTRSQRTESGG